MNLYKHKYVNIFIYIHISIYFYIYRTTYMMNGQSLTSEKVMNYPSFGIRKVGFLEKY